MRSSSTRRCGSPDLVNPTCFSVVSVRPAESSFRVSDENRFDQTVEHQTVNAPPCVAAAATVRSIVCVADRHRDLVPIHQKAGRLPSGPCSRCRQDIGASINQLHKNCLGAELVRQIGQIDVNRRARFACRNTC